MIEFIEKEPRKSYDYWNMNECLMYPNFMIKDGKEFFIMNRRVPQPKYKDNEIQEHIKQLKENNGAYITFYGANKIPIDMLKDIVERQFSFVEPTELFRKSELNDFVDFHGNLNELAAAFRYRIYDTEMLKDIKKIVSLINNKEWEKANESITNLQSNNNKIQKDNEYDIDI